MSTNGETADLMVREGIQITESALKLAGLGAKNLAALLIALANDNQKLAGKTNLKRLIHDGEELTIFSVKQEDLKGFQMEAKRYWAEHHRAEHSADQGAVRKGMGEHHRQLRHAAVPRRRQRTDLVGVYCEAAGQGDHRHPHTGADEGSQRLQLYQLPTDGPRPDDH